MGQDAAAVFGIPHSDMLQRVDRNPPRSSQSRKAMPATFTDLLQEVTIKASGNLIKGEKVLLVDDLKTQGVTAAAAAYALRAAGAADVRLLTFGVFSSQETLEGYCD